MRGENGLRRGWIPRPEGSSLTSASKPPPWASWCLALVVPGIPDLMAVGTAQFDGWTKVASPTDDARGAASWQPEKLSGRARPDDQQFRHCVDHYSPQVAERADTSAGCLPDLPLVGRSFQHRWRLWKLAVAS